MTLAEPIAVTLSVTAVLDRLGLTYAVGGALAAYEGPRFLSTAASLRARFVRSPQGPSVSFSREKKKNDDVRATGTNPCACK